MTDSPLLQDRLVLPDGGVDGAALRRALTALAREHPESALRPLARETLRAALTDSRAAIMDRFRAGEAGGLETARRLSRETDELVRAIYDFTTVHVFRSRNPTEGERFCVAAVGGFGRAELAPHSDLDLLFLRGWKQSAWEESVIEYMLYMLWDLGLKVGHAARNVDDCIKRAKGDQQILTNLLDARLICGDREVFESLSERLQQEAIKGRERDYVGAKLAERDARHARAGANRYMVEPDVKEGKGGLRDLQTLEWLARALFPGRGIDALPGAGLLSDEDRASHDAAKEFFWSVRLHLHDIAGRAQEMLSFDFQPEMAARMGYDDAESVPAVERFMRAYFRMATNVGSLVRIASARLEALHAKPAPGGMSRFLPFVRAKRPRHPAFDIRSGRLMIAEPGALRADPVLVLELFAEAARLGVDVHPDALARARLRAHLVEGVRDSRRAASALFTILDASAPEVALRLMTETGVMEHFLPEFGAIVGRTQFNMYHAYTVDEHTLQAISVLARLREGKLAHEHPLASEAFPDRKHHRALFLAMLLHDTGKGAGDQSIEGEKSARAACTRLGVPEEETELVAWLVRHHLDMSAAAQTRDIGNPRTIADFAELVETRDRLRLLLCLTVADIKAVAPGVWTGFKAELLRELYRLTETALAAKETEAVAAASHSLAYRASLARAAARTRGGDDPALTQWGGRMDDSYWLAFGADEILAHARFAQDADREGAAHAARARVDQRRGATELLVRAPDRLGLFADIAAAIVSVGAEVADARIYTTSDGEAFDIFYLQNPRGEPFGAGAAHALRHLESVVLEAAQGHGPTAPGEPAPATARQAVFEITPQVRLDDEASDAHTVVEASGRNRPALLADLAAAIAESNLSVASAHIETLGERVIDVFYVNKPGGGAVRDPRARAALTAALMRVLSSGERACWEASAKRGVRRAPSSQVR